MSMRVRALVLLIGTLLGVSGLAGPASAAEVKPPIVEVATVPALPGVRFVFDGVSYTTDEQGLVRLTLTKPQPATHALSIVDVSLHQRGRDLAFVRWWHVGAHDQDRLTTITGIKVRRHVRIQAAFRATYKVSYSFVDPAQGPVDHKRVKRVEFSGDNGRTVASDGTGKLRLVGIQAKVSSGTLVAKQVSYTVQTVEVDGSNVVQMNHQTFVPSQKATVVVPLLLRTAHLSTRDLLFGSAVGKSVALTYPDGRQTSVRLDRHGKATVENLARGLYTMKVNAPGYSFDRPVALSRNQYIDLPVLTYLDIAVGSGLLMLVGGILFAMRIRTRRAHNRQVPEAS
jgi:hypothetical protein